MLVVVALPVGVGKAKQTRRPGERRTEAPVLAVASLPSPMAGAESAKEAARAAFALRCAGEM